MNYLIAIIATLLCVLLAYITLNEEKSKKARLLHILDGNGDFESKQITKKKYYILICIVAALSGVAAFWIIFHVEDILNVIKMQMALVCLTGAACNDYREHRIPNIFSIVLALTGLICLAVGYISNQEGAMSYVVSSLFATVAVALCLTLASALTKHGIGFGDIKLLCALSLIGGVYTICGTLFFGVTACALSGILLVITKKKTIKGALPFGPFILVGFLISIFASIY